MVVPSLILVFTIGIVRWSSGASVVVKEGDMAEPHWDKSQTCRGRQDERQTQPAGRSQGRAVSGGSRTGQRTTAFQSQPALFRELQASWKNRLLTCSQTLPQW